MFHTLMAADAKEVFYALRDSCRYCKAHDLTDQALGIRHECTHPQRPHEGTDITTALLIVGCAALKGVL